MVTSKTKVVRGALPKDRLESIDRDVDDRHDLWESYWADVESHRADENDRKSQPAEKDLASSVDWKLDAEGETQVAEPWHIKSGDPTAGAFYDIESETYLPACALGEELGVRHAGVDEIENQLSAGLDPHDTSGLLRHHVDTDGTLQALQEHDDLGFTRMVDGLFSAPT